MRALLVAADAHEAADQAWLPEALARTLSATTAAVLDIADFPLKEAVEAANLWAGQTGTFAGQAHVHVNRKASN